MSFNKMKERKFAQKNKFRIMEFLNRNRIKKISYQVENNSPIIQNQQPIVFFNASTRMHYLSQNAAFSLLTSWGLQLAGKQIIHFVCQAGMEHCVLGTNIDDVNQPPPCDACQIQSDRLFTNENVIGFSQSKSINLTNKLSNLSLSELKNFIFEGLPLGEIVLPSLRWILRRHNLIEDKPTQLLFKSYIRSASSIANNFQDLINNQHPSHLILFNGQMYPEAICKIVAQKNGVEVITHEVGLMPLTAFFTRGEATAYPLPIPEDFELSDKENKKLDQYLSNRFEGNFSMAGIKFWPDMKSLDSKLISKMEDFKNIIPIFTNVIFDTSQKHANTIFPDMFKWMESLIEIIKNNTDTLFILRAHPDESREGKAATESVAEFVKKNNLLQFNNLLFVDSKQSLSSYDLIQRSKFVLVYNSSIGLESIILGKPVLSAGKARYSQYPIVTFPKSANDYQTTLSNWLSEPTISVASGQIINARKFLFFQLFKSSLPFSQFIKPHDLPGYVYLNKFSFNELSRENSIAIDTIIDGLESQSNFLLK